MKRLLLIALIPRRERLSTDFLYSCDLAVELRADIQIIFPFFYIEGWKVQTRESKMDFISVCGTITFLTMLGFDDGVDTDYSSSLLIVGQQ
jgi:hypothetical protein